MLVSRRIKTTLLALGIFIISLLIIDLYLFPLPKERLYKKPSRFIYSQEGKLLNCFASEDFFWRKPVKLKKISDRLIKSVLASEDRFYYYHPGINPFSIISAAWTNLRQGKIVRGGSTITMQIARMMDRRPRTIKSKMIEVLRSFQLERHYSKNELLEIYFNLVPYGGNIEGVGAASYFYFDKSPDKLSLSEAAILTAIPTSPNNFRPDLNLQKCRTRRDFILAYLYKGEIVSEEEYYRALEEDIPVERLKRPFYAPHFSQSLINRFPDSCELYSCINYNIQLQTERLAHNYFLGLKGKGINNLSVVILDSRSSELLALVGSPDFEDRLNAGQINGALSYRSPGSALKPFVYALGFELGLITPATLLEDIPVSYAGYSPENYDEEYHGLVSVKNALVQSLNVPAVNLTAEVGLETYYSLLKEGGLLSLNRKYYEYGLPLVLGACEVSLLDLSNLYSALAREGQHQTIKILTGQPKEKPKRILSEEACFLVTNILSDLQRPELASSWEFTLDMPTVAWKTGTSYGRKDAWAIGYNRHHTVGVWAGNFSSEGSPYLVGATAAAPLMLHIFQELTLNKDIKWYEPPPNIEIRSVCAASGENNNKSCPSTSDDYYIYSVSSNRKCTVHNMVQLNEQTGDIVCPACSYGIEIDTIVVEQWPARVSNWLLGQGQVATLPRHNPDCLGMVRDERPIINSPEDNAIYEIRQNTPLEYQKLLFEASASLASSQLHWFLDKNYYATCEPDQPLFYLPQAGRHELICLDDFGRSAKISFAINNYSD